MSTFLTEAGWKAILSQPKNIGLKAQGTGISDKLRKYESVNKGYLGKKSASGADEVLKALGELKTLADKESKAHKAFADATKYLIEIVKAAKTREDQIRVDKETLARIGKVVVALKLAYAKVASIKTAKEFQAQGGDSLNGAVRTLMEAGKFKEVSGNTMAKLNNRCLVDTSLKAVTDENVKAKTAEVKSFLDELTKELKNVKI